MEWIIVLIIGGIVWIAMSMQEKSHEKTLAELEDAVKAKRESDEEALLAARRREEDHKQIVELLNRIPQLNEKGVLYLLEKYDGKKVADEVVKQVALKSKEDEEFVGIGGYAPIFGELILLLSNNNDELTPFAEAGVDSDELPLLHLNIHVCAFLTAASHHFGYEGYYRGGFIRTILYSWSMHKLIDISSKHHDAIEEDVTSYEFQINRLYVDGKCNFLQFYLSKESIQKIQYSPMFDVLSLLVTTKQNFVYVLFRYILSLLEKKEIIHPNPENYRVSVDRGAFDVTI